MRDAQEPERNNADATLTAPPPSTPNRIHYRPLWDERLEQANRSGEGPVAVLVCHGMGQQVRYETISSVAEALLTEARDDKATVSPVEVTLAQANDDFLARAEVKWEKDGRSHEVHVYEAYWAPLTEGKVTYWDTVKFLLRAGWDGLKFSRPFRASSFQRWMFGGPKQMRIGRMTWISLVGVLVFLLLQVGVIAFVSLTLAAQAKVALANFPIIAGGFGHWGLSCLRWLALFIPGAVPGESFTWATVARTVIWLLLTAEAFVVRFFVIEFVGDVAAYVSAYKDSKFDDLRHQIRKIGLNVGQVVYGMGARQSTVPNYSRVLVVGHSLGSVLAYDTLNSLINADQVCADADRRNVVGRTCALITFGSPLDKTAFIFRLQTGSEAQWVREQLAASAQPLIVDYAKYRPEPFRWINIWSPMDIISGSLDYYDDPAVPLNSPQHVDNMIDKQASTPLLAHVQYWQNPLLRKQLYEYVS